ncbi:branched-chain amino acid ABC transporter permease [Pseudoruegeria sp. HB172150]|uniref:branched-chain amino acid ABC transporter permease n=1 Tax=Pseudoruegeria sp. HB172150 TaxID=2721164 RepID=UPI001556B61B|nr:branched-chain amino acid ABC transporter permease [Pseudoruegeria sp. HB172150]
MKRLIAYGLVLLFLLFATAPYTVNAGLVFIAGIAMTEIIFALSWNMLFSYAGLASFGHAAFFGVGAYTAAVFLKYDYGLHFLLVIALGTFLGGVSSFVVAIIVLRRASGIQLAILTLALSQLVVTLIGYSAFLGRDEGIPSIPRPVMEFGLFRIDMNDQVQAYYFLFVMSLLAVALMWLLLHGYVGRRMKAVAIDPERAAFVGIDVWRVRVFAFTIGGAFAAFAGCLLVPWAQIVTPDLVMWLHSAQPMLATLLGGAGFFWGPIIGVLVLSMVNYATRTFAGLSEVLVGGILLIVVLLAPQGIMGFLRRIVERSSTGKPAMVEEQA